MKKRILALAILLSLALSLIPTSAGASASRLTWETNWITAVAKATALTKQQDGCKITALAEDLDIDGRSDLIVKRSEDGRISTDIYYISGTKAVLCLSNDGWDLNFQLMQKGSSKFFIATGSKTSSSAARESTFKITNSGRNIKKSELFSVRTTTDGAKEYFVSKKSVSEKEYNKQYKAYFDKLKQISRKQKYYKASDFSKAGAKSLATKMIDGFSGIVSPPKTFAELAPTTKMSFKELVGDDGDYSIPTKFPDNQTYQVVVDERWQIVMVYSQDKNGKYTIPVRYAICSTGSSSTPTRKGTFKVGVNNKNKYAKVRFGEFTGQNCYAQYWTHITSRTFFHSLLYSKKNAATYTTTSYKNLGTRCSHGCVRLTVPDARWIFYHIGPGTTIIVRTGSSSDSAAKAIKNKLKLAKLPSSRPSLKPGKIPNTDNWSKSSVLSS